MSHHSRIPPHDWYVIGSSVLALRQHTLPLVLPPTAPTSTTTSRTSYASTCGDNVREQPHSSLDSDVISFVADSEPVQHPMPKLAMFSLESLVRDVSLIEADLHAAAQGGVKQDICRGGDDDSQRNSGVCIDARGPADVNSGGKDKGKDVAKARGQTGSGGPAPSRSSKRKSRDMDSNSCVNNAKLEKAWEFSSQIVPGKLTQLYDCGYDITIMASFTVEKSEKLARLYQPQKQKKIDVGVGENADVGVDGDTVASHPLLDKYASFLRKIENFIRKLQFPVSVYISLAYDVFCIPARGLFDLVLDAHYDMWQYKLAYHTLHTCVSSHDNTHTHTRAYPDVHTRAPTHARTHAMDDAHATSVAHVAGSAIAKRIDAGREGQARLFYRKVKKIMSNSSEVGMYDAEVEPPSRLIDHLRSFYVGTKSGNVQYQENTYYGQNTRFSGNSTYNRGVPVSHAGNTTASYVHHPRSPAVYDSDVDRAFACNLGVTYLEPESVFGNSCTMDRFERFLLTNPGAFSRFRGLPWRFSSTYPITEFPDPRSHSQLSYTLQQLPVSLEQSQEHDHAQGQGGASPQHLVAIPPTSATTPSPAPGLDVLRERFSTLPVPHVVMLVGFPGSGKTTIARSFFPDHQWVNQDTLKSFGKVANALRGHLIKRNNVIVDRTHGTLEGRRKIIDICQELSAPVLALWVDAPMSLAMLMNIVRQHTSRGAVELVPPVAYYAYQRDFTPPSTDEGIAYVIKIPWIPRLPTLPSGVSLPLRALTKHEAQTYVPPYKVPFGKSAEIPDSVIRYSGTDGPCATGVGVVSRSRGYCDFFYQRVHILDTREKRH